VNTTQDSSESKSFKQKVYRILAITSLVLMALLWSLDSFFIYCFLGSAIYFVFLFYWNRPVENPDPRQGFSKGAYSEFEKTFSSRERSASSAQTLSSPGRKVAVIMSMAVFGFSIFFITVVVILFSDGDSSEDSFFWYQRASDFARSGTNDSAKFYYRKVFASDTEGKDALLEYGNLLLDDKDYDSALYYYGRVIELDNTSSAAYYNQALVKYFQEDYATSLKEALDLLQLSPSYADAQVLAGDNYYAQQKYDSAFVWYDQGYTNGVRSAWLSHVLGYLYDTKNDTEKAITLYKEAVQYDSSKTDVCLRLGELLPGQEGDAYRQLAYRKQ
jgi:tetratricopeptide (TPR) repeat protein